MTSHASLALALLPLLVLPACGGEDIWIDDRWAVSATVDDDHVRIAATIADVHGDFVHVSIRKEGHDNRYTVERSPAPNQPERDWTRVHHWFGELHPDTYLEGRFDDGRGRGPRSFQTLAYDLPRAGGGERANYDDVLGSDYVYITRGYSYADGNSRHPAFDAGTYEIEIYAWYTGQADETHPSAGDEPGVQYIHYEQPLVATTFVIE